SEPLCPARSKSWSAAPSALSSTSSALSGSNEAPMTLHVVYNHQCPECGAYYIPYDLVPCPRCGWQEAERFDYIPQATASMLFNKRHGGRYTPGAWWVGSLGDHILHLLFGLFDAYEEEGSGVSFPPWAEARLAACNWGEQTYLQAHVAGIAVRV